MPALRAGHSPQDVRLARGQPLGDELVHPTRDDLAAPRLEQPVANLLGDVGRAYGHSRTG
jgi:hypothetical protein